MNLVIDTSIVLAVITNESHKPSILKVTKRADLIAPSSLHWEIGNAFSAMFKRSRVTLEQAILAITAYKRIPIRFSDIELEVALGLAESLNVCAYDAYVIGCALKHKSPILTLDGGLVDAAQRAGVKIKGFER